MYSPREKKYIAYPEHYIVKPVLRGHVWANEAWSYKTDDFLDEVQFT